MYQSYFISILPPNPINNRIQKVQRNFQKRFNNKGSDSPPHITLLHPFQIKQQKEELLVNKLENFFRSIQPFDIRLSGFSNFSSNVIFIDVKSSKLSAINKKLINLADLNPDIIFKKSEYPYKAHITIAEKLKNSIFSEAFRIYKNKSFNAHFTAQKTWLLKYIGDQWNTIEDFNFKE